jgi:polyisoprenoid-binding protein YceI
MHLSGTIINRRRAGSRLVAGLLAAAVLATGATTMALAQDDAATPTAADCNVEQAVAEAPLVYTVNSETSTASYVAQEELATVGASEVIGTTNAIIGSILLDDEGNPLKCSNFAVDLRTLETDESRRDNFLRENTLESETYPFATFVLASVEGLDGPIEDGETVTAQLVGDLSIHGVTKSTTWEAEITRDGEILTGTASHTFLIADYDMEKPIVGPVVSIEDEIELRIDIVAEAGEA